MGRSIGFWGQRGSQWPSCAVFVRAAGATVDVIVSVDVSVDGDGDGDVAVGDHLQSLVSIATMRSSSSQPRLCVFSSTSLSTRSASRTAAHSMAEPRAIA